VYFKSPKPGAGLQKLCCKANFQGNFNESADIGLMRHSTSFPIASQSSQGGDANLDVETHAPDFHAHR
jgi:hypothetical protein